MSAKTTTIVLHIGLHKTGTTSIQNFLHVNQEALLRQGILYPDAGRCGKDGKQHESHLFHAWSVVKLYADKYGIELSGQSWRMLREEIEKAKPDRAILSSEFFWSATEQEVQQIKSYLDGYPVEVVLYVRNPVDLAVSTYKQGVKKGRISSSLSAHYMARLRQYDFDATVSRWASVFGPDRVKLHIFEKAKHNLVAHFAGVAGIDWSEHLTVPPRVNVSPSDGVIRLVRWINILERWLEPVGLGHYAHRARRNLLCARAPGRWIARLADKYLCWSIVTEADEQQFRAETKKLVDRFVDKHVRKEDRKFFSYTSNGVLSRTLEEQSVQE